MRISFRIRNFLPHTFKDVEVYFKNSNITKPLKVAVIEEVASLAEIELDLPLKVRKFASKMKMEIVQNMKYQP